MLLKGHFPEYGECPFSVVMVKTKTMILSIMLDTFYSHILITTYAA
jgi:hypothetical protein